MTYDPEIIQQRMYRIFRIRDEDYILTVKFMLIFAWAETRSDNPIATVEELRKSHYRRGKMKVVEALYKEAQDGLLRRNGRYAPPNAVVPQGTEIHISGWLP